MDGFEIIFLCSKTNVLDHTCYFGLIWFAMRGAIIRSEPATSLSWLHIKLNWTNYH